MFKASVTMYTAMYVRHKAARWSRGMIIALGARSRVQIPDEPNFLRVR